VTLTEGVAQATLMRWRWQRNFVLPNFAPAGWFECDVFELTARGYFREYEIKLSRADFRKDATKSSVKWVQVEKRVGPAPDVRTELEPIAISKHAMLAAGDVRGPRQFWYVTPVDLVKIEEVPAQGAVAVDSTAGRRALRAMHDALHAQAIVPRSVLTWHEEEVRHAPFLHREKAGAGMAPRARVACYYRLHRLLAAVPELRAVVHPQDPALDPAQVCVPDDECDTL